MAKSGITISNQERLRRYNAERAQEERNDVIQQAELYGKLAEENALDAQAASLARLAKGVFKKSFDAINPDVKKQITKISTTLLGSVKNGKLDELVKSIISIPDGLLNPRQIIIKNDLKNPEFKRMLNDAMAEEVEKGSSAEEILKVVKDLVAGSEGQADLEDMVSKSRSGSIDSISSAGSDDSITSDATTAITWKTDSNKKYKKISYRDLNQKLIEMDRVAIPSLAEDFGFKIDPTIENKNTMKSFFIAAVNKKKLLTNIPEKSINTIILNSAKLPAI